MSLIHGIGLNNTVDSGPLISIITPAFNHEKFIAECIHSVQAQTYQNWEMIIIDDGSQDNTCHIVERYRLEDSRIKLIKQEHIGIFKLSETYNKALRQTSGQYIAILEGDDYWVENKLELQLQHMINSNAVVCWGKAHSISHDIKTLYGLYPDTGKTHEVQYFLNTPMGSILNVFLYRNCIPALTLLIKKESLLDIGGFLQPYHLPLVDLPTLYALALSGEFVYVDQPLGYWRIYPSQVTKTYTAEMTEGFRLLAFEYYEKTRHLPAIDSAITRNKLARHYNKQLIISYSRSGRYKLIRRQFEDARKDYLKSIFNFGCLEPVWKLRSLTGLIFSYFRSDVEGLTKILGKKTYKNH